MENTPVIELDEAQLDEVFGGAQVSTTCSATASVPCPDCANA